MIESYSEIEKRMFEKYKELTGCDFQSSKLCRVDKKPNFPSDRNERTA